MHDQPSVTPCQFDAAEGGWKCAACGRFVRSASAKPPKAVCRGNTVQPSSQRPSRPRPGDELTAILRDWLGITADEGCGCKSMASRMNALGPDWCESEEGLAEILGVMREEHGKRWADGRTRLPWSDYGAKQLIRLACYRARSKAKLDT